MRDALTTSRGPAPRGIAHFMAQVSAFDSQWRDHFVPLIFRKAQLAGFSDLPAFRFEEERSTAVASRVGTALLGLLVPAVLLAFAARRWLARYPVVG